jgi:hypothetical protein
VIKKNIWNILAYFSSETLAILSASHSNEHKGQLFCHLVNMGAKSSMLQVSEGQVLWKIFDPRSIKCWI